MEQHEDKIPVQEMYPDEPVTTEEKAYEQVKEELGQLPEDETLTAQYKKRRSRAKNRKKFSLADYIVDNNIVIRNIVIVLVILFALCYPLVGVNYDLTKYLPNTVDSKIAINKMRDVFGYPGTGRLMIRDVTLYEAKEYKDEIEKIKGVYQVLWADMTTNIHGASSFIDYEEIKDYYRDNCAVMDVTFSGGDTSKLTQRAIDEIERIVGDRGCIVGMSPTSKFIEENVKREMSIIMVLVVILIFFILLVTTTSWFEPILFLSVIGCAIAINKGSNIFIGEISYITNNISDILQLATSMDYSVFLLHAYERQREAGLDKEAALKAGLNNTIGTILSSSLTTFFGFIVLVFMKFTIGFDMGIVMAKGIICSLLMVIFMMPSLLLSWSDLIDKTRHKPFLPQFHHFSIIVSKAAPYVVIISLLLAFPIYVAQGMNNFMYGPDATGAGPGTSMYENSADIDVRFGRSNLLVAIFPDNDSQKEKALVEELEDKPYVKKALGLSGYLPEGVPETILPGKIAEMFHKDGYARLLIYIKTKPESPTAYKYSQEVTDIIRRYYGEEAYITGNTPTTKDMEAVLVPDYTLVNNLAMLSIFLVVAIAFRTPIMPIAAMIPIMMAIYVNMAVPYIQGNTLIFIAYAVVSCIQLGSTIDYAISCTENYVQIRQTEPDKKKASQKMTEVAFPSILTSGTILVVCGYAINFISSIPAISEVGHLVGRGAILSVFFVVGMMPALLRLIDRYITVPAAVRHAQRRAIVIGAWIDRRNRRRLRHERFRQILREQRMKLTGGTAKKAEAMDEGKKES